jgi:alpha-1,6-mannosyltransferase
MNRIAMIANFNGPKSGGLKTVMNELALQYSNQGISCIQIIPGSRKEVIDNGIYKIYKIKSIVIPFSGGYRLILNLNAVKKVLNNFKPSTIEIHDRLTLIPIAKWAQKRGILSIAFAHERLYLVAKTFLHGFPGLRKIVKKLNDKLIKNVDFVIATTFFAAQEFEEYQREKIKLVPLGVDSKMFTPEKRTRKYDPHLISLTLCSRLSKEKNPEKVFKIVKQMNASKTRVNLTVIGSGPMKKNLQKKYKDFSIKFLDYVSDKNQISNVLANSDVLLAPGPYETFCLTALEAQASGTPVVGSEKSAVKEIISDDSGLVVNDNLTNWISAIEIVSSNSKYRESSRQNALNYSWNKCANQLLDIYETHTNGRK